MSEKFSKSSADKESKKDEALENIPRPLTSKERGELQAIIKAAQSDAKRAPSSGLEKKKK